ELVTGGLIERGHAVTERRDPERGDRVEVPAPVDVDELVPLGRLDDDRRVLRVAGHLREAVPDDGRVALRPLFRRPHGRRCYVRPAPAGQARFRSLDAAAPTAGDRPAPEARA